MESSSVAATVVVSMKRRPGPSTQHPAPKPDHRVARRWRERQGRSLAPLSGVIASLAFATLSRWASAQEPPAPPDPNSPPAPTAGTAAQPAEKPASPDSSTPPLSEGNEQAPTGEDAPALNAASGQPALDSAEGEEEELVPLADAAEATKTASTGTHTEGAPDSSAREEQKEDTILYSGYLPGYRQHIGLGVSPYSPTVGTLPGGMTAGYGAPVPPSEWTFTYAGFMTASLQVSIDRRRHLEPGQSETVYHVPPTTIDSWGSFTSSNSIPGNWVSMRFRYGNARVSGNVSMETWNPSRPSTYYQIGSQYFLNNAFVSYSPASMAGIRLRVDVGRYNTSYGTLGRWGSGLYVNPLSGTVQGIGERVIAEYDLPDPYMVVIEHGVMTRSDGKVPSNVVASAINGWRRPLWAAAWIHHAHLGLIRKGEPRVEFQLHYLTNWSQEDRNGSERDNPGTREIDESDVRDGRITVFGSDLKLLSDTFGVLGIGASLTRGRDSFPLKGLSTYGEEGEQLTDKWWGVTSGGTGKLLVAAINYQVSLGKVLSYPESFGGDGPDVVINTGFHWTKTWTPYEGYDKRTRHKYGVDAMYTFMKYLGVGLRLDRVAPNSYNADETYHVVAPRLQFKTDWNSRETIQLMYAKWFYGTETRNEGTGLRTPEQLDDQLIALNFNMWW